MYLDPERMSNNGLLDSFKKGGGRSKAIHGMVFGIQFHNGTLTPSWGAL